MISKLFNIYLEINFRILAYGVGYILLALSYLTSFIIPPLKKVLKEYDSIGSGSSIFWITFSSTITLILLFAILETIFLNDPSFGLIYYIVSFLVWMACGHFALFLLADYRKKAIDRS